MMPHVPLSIALTLLLPLAFGGGVVEAFTAQGPGTKSKSQRIRPLDPLNVGTGIEPTSSNSNTNKPTDSAIMNPSTRFGNPVSDEMKEFNKGMVGFLKRAIFDTIFAGRDYPRFYALETIARVPYFSYTAALHFYETIGLWRKADYLKVHFAETKSGLSQSALR